MAVVDELSLHEAAARAGVHYMTVYRWVRTGRLPARRDGAEWRVSVGDLDAARHRGSRAPHEAGGRRRTRSRAAAAERLRRRLVAGDEAGAWALLEEVMTAGASAAEVALDVIGPAMQAVGDRWESGNGTVAEEHRASVVAGRLLGRLGPRFARPGRKRGTIVLGAPAGEEHSLPGILLADVLRGTGYDVVDLGADTPAESFVEAAQGAPRLLAVLIGVTTSGNDRAVRDTVTALRGAGIAAPVLVGGGAVSGDAHARRLGADAWTGVDGRAALATVEAVTRSR